MVLGEMLDMFICPLTWKPFFVFVFWDYWVNSLGAHFYTVFSNQLSRYKAGMEWTCDESSVGRKEVNERVLNLLW